MDTETFEVRQRVREPDGVGGFDDIWVHFIDVDGYLDLVNGTDLNGQQNAFIQQSTHMLIIPNIPKETITDKMRIAGGGKVYDVTYPDDPVNAHHHLEVYLTFAGVDNG